MATRRERVVLELEDNFSSGMARAAAMTALLDKQLDSLSGSAVDSRTAMRTTASDVDKVGASSNRAGDSINQLTGRLRFAADALALFGPAAVPIGAVAIPAVMGLANQMGILAVGAGTAVLAFQGVGDAFKAVEKARLDPTVANLAEVQRLMSDLEPAARGFVEQIDTMRPAFDSIQNSAAAGLFPGFTEGLADLESMVGPVRSAVGEIAAGFGVAAAAEADAFDSARGREFINFLGNEAPQTLSVLFETIRNLGAGMGELWMTFQPTNNDFADWLLGQSQAFDTWSQQLGQTQGFEDFLSYISETGPKVADALGAIGNMVLQVVEAAAPLGGPVLEGLEFFADTVAAIADSDIGAPLVAAAAAAALLNRGLQLTSKLLPAAVAPIPATAAPGALPTTKAPAAAAPIGFGSAGKQATQISSQLGVLQTRATAAQGAVRNLGSALAFSAYSGATLAKSAASTSAAVSTSAQKAIAARSAVVGYSGAALKAGAAVAAMGVLSTEAGQGLGVTNTALLGLTGAMAGPGGAALGAGVGLVLDLASASGQADKAVSMLKSSVSDAGNDFNKIAAIGDGAAQSFIDYSDSASLATKTLSGWDELLTGSSGFDTVAKESVAAAEQADKTIEAFTTLGTVIDGGYKDAIGRDVLPSMEQLSDLATRSQPALDQLGVSLDDVANMDAGQLQDLGRQIVDIQQYADSAAGRTEAFAKSVADLGNDALSTAETASTFATALQSMLAPALGAEAATDTWRQSLIGLKDSLVDGAGFEGFTKGALANRAATRDYANASMERLTALAQVSTTTEGDMARAVGATRREFIKSAVAAGLDRKAVIARANAMGLTPKMVRTVFEAAGISKSEQQARQLRASYKSLPKAVRSEIKADGVPKTKGELKDLLGRYKGLSKQQVRTLVRLQADAARKGITNIDRLLKALGKRSPRPKVNVDVGAARNQIGGVDKGLGGLAKRRTNPKITADGGQARNQISAVDKALGKTGRTRTEAKIGADNGRAMQAIQQTNQGLQQLNSFTSTSNINGNAADALGAVSSARSALSALNGTTATTYIRTVRIGGKSNEDGGLHVNGERAFADGGYGVNGQYFSRVPQIVPGGADIRWGEKSTGWEAYISGKPSQRERNVGILGEAANRLGVAVTDRPQAARPVAMSRGAQGGGGGEVRVVFDGPVEIPLRMPDGSVQIARIAARVANQEIDNWERSEKARAGL